MTVGELSAPETSAKSEVHCEDLFDRIVAKDESAYTELYHLIGRAVRARVQREFPDDVGDVCHNVFIDVFLAIQRGVIRKPGSLLSFIRQVAYRRRSTLIEGKITRRERSGVCLDPVCEAARPDQLFQQAEERELAMAVLQLLPHGEQELIRRFYIEEQSKEKVLSETGLAFDQFRLKKSRALGRLRQHVAAKAAGTLSNASRRAG
jgi:DNA-directed RNA polymerase specialized sigma24 family protein